MKKLKVDTLIRFWIIAIVVFMYTMLAFGQNQTSIGTIGPRGYTGARGPAGTLSIGTVSTGDPGTNVVITNVGTVSNAVLNITIPRGSNILSGTGAPATSIGGVQDYYLDTAAGCLYGPKANPVGGAWPGTCKSLIGPAGPTGPQGPSGAGNPSGGLHSIQINGIGSTAGSFQPSTFLTDPTNSDLLGVRNLTSGNSNYWYNADLNSGVMAFAATSTCVSRQCNIFIPPNSSDLYTPSNGNVGFGGNYKYPDAFGKSVRVIDNRFGGFTDYTEDENDTDALPHLISSANFHIPSESWAAGGNTALTVSVYDQATGQYNYGAESGSYDMRYACDTRGLGINECIAGTASMYGAGDKVWSYIYWYYAACGYGNGDDEHCHFLGHQANETGGTLPVGVINAVNPNGGTNDLYLDPGSYGTVTKIGNNRTLMLVKNADGSDASVLHGCTVTADNTSFHNMPVLTVTGCTLPVSTFQGHIDASSMPIATPKNFQVPQSMTFLVDTDSGTATVGNFCIGDVHRREVGKFTSVAAVSGGFQVTALIINNYIGDDIGTPPSVFQGGLCGTTGREVSGILNNGVNVSTPPRAPSTNYSLGQQVVDPFHHIQQVTTAGTSSSTSDSLFVWNHWTTTTDGSVTWTDEGYVVAPMSVSFNIMGSPTSTTLAYDFPSGFLYHRLTNLYENVVPQSLACYLTRASNVVTATCAGQNINGLPVTVSSSADPSFNGTYVAATAPIGAPTGYSFAYTWSETGADVSTAVVGYLSYGVGQQELAIYPSTQVIGMTAPTFTSDTHTTTSGEYVKLQNNSITWPVGGLVEEEFDGVGANFMFNLTNAYEPQTTGNVQTCQGSSCIGVVNAGNGGDGGGFFFQQYENDGAASLYQGLGGFNPAPDVMELDGPFQNYFKLSLGSASAWMGPIPGSTFVRAECAGEGISSCAVTDGQWDLLYADTNHYQAVSGQFGGAHIRVDAYNDALQMWVDNGAPFGERGPSTLQIGPNYVEQVGGNNPAFYISNNLEIGFTHGGIDEGASPQIELLRSAGGHITMNGYQLRSHQDTLLGVSSYGSLDITADTQLTLHSGFLTPNHCLWLTGTYYGVSQLIATGDLSGGDTAGVGCVSTILGSTANGFVTAATEGAGASADQWTISTNVDGTHYLPTTTDKNFWNLSLQYVGTLTLTAAGPDSLSVSGLTSTNHCTASYLTGTPVALGASAGSGSVTISHPTAVAGDTVSVFCN